MRGWFVLKQTVKMVIRNVSANRTRTFLTCLGIIIGIASLIAMVTVYELNVQEAQEEIRSKGLKDIEVTVNMLQRKTGYIDADFDYFKSIEDVTGLDKLVEPGSTTAIVSKKYIKNTSVTGHSVNFFILGSKIDIVSGAPFNGYDETNATKVCLVNEALAKELDPSKPAEGQTIQIYGVRFTVIGVYKEKETNPMPAVLAPHTTLTKITGKGIFKVTIYSAAESKSATIDKAVKNYMNKISHFGEWSLFMDMFFESQLTSKIEEAKNQALMQLVIAGLCLLIGGIGIMNMMLVMVSERTQEIGLRKALGATPGRIQLQFVCESIVISLLGGLGGIILGIGLSLGYCYMMHTPYHVSIISIFVGLAFAVVVGVVFGWAPARTASILNPIDALKGE